MARIRSAKPEWWSKAKWCALPRDVRFTYKGIWEVMADDAGRFEADPRQVKAAVWPLDDDITARKVAQWLPLLAAVRVTLDDKVTRVPAIVLYEVDGVQYGFLPGFVKHQKISHATPSKLPAPPDNLRSDSGNPPEILRPDVDLDVDGDVDGERSRKGSGTAAAESFPDIAQALTDPDDPHLFAHLTQRIGHDPDAQRAYLRECQRVLAGITPPHLDPAQLRQACRDFLTNRAPPNIGLFRGYLRKAAQPATNGRPGDDRIAQAEAGALAAARAVRASQAKRPA